MSQIFTMDIIDMHGHFADEIFKCIFLNQNYLILIQIPQMFVPRGPIDNLIYKHSLRAQSIVALFSDAHIRPLASMT